jgi:hypothetical protein
VDCTVSFIQREEGVLLQLDTLGSKDRKITGKVSQSIQLDEDAARQLLGFIARAFPAVGRAIAHRPD